VPVETLTAALDPTEQVDTQELIFAETFENATNRVDSTNSRYNPYRRQDSKLRSKSPSKSPISRNRRERPEVGPPQSSIQPPIDTLPDFGLPRAEEATKELARRSPITLQNPLAPQPPVQNSSQLVYENPVSQP